ncbi:hypothetical protein KP509_30G051000 [Ceratopteris richardii]|uniref:Shikimate dehydrogenase (NADP(+)) n=3 Tax=Ceratopteris richardii TaxID=49495 RepID=A0A8T2R2H6_CERRI|nr:hypothetical protein KP509_30G051000 [Ceratopteris richardii]
MVNSLSLCGGGCYICVPLLAGSISEMLREMRIAHSKGADMVEFRLDHLTEFEPQADIPILLQEKQLPAIITCRPVWEGGKYNGDDDDRISALALAAELGADFVDIEMQKASELISALQKPSRAKVIVSHHNFDCTPSSEELGCLVSKMQSTGADIIKVVTTARSITDVIHVFQVLGRSQAPTIALAMGQQGLISRLLTPKFGGFLTFGSMASGRESAPGQPTIEELQDIYRLPRVGRETEVFGIIGQLVGYSKSPLIHNRFFQEIGYDGLYVPFLVHNFKVFFGAFHPLNFTGFSISIPYKEVALECCDEVESFAKAIGAVNTVVRRRSDGKFIGYNTDCEAAVGAIEDGLGGVNDGVSPLFNKLVVVIGAGGAAKAIAFGAKQRGAHPLIANRHYDRAQKLAEAVGGTAITLDQLYELQPSPGSVLANTTPIGMFPNENETPMPKSVLKHYSLVFDVVYTPKVTRLLTEAEELGLCVVSGFEMFIRQAIEQFSLFVAKPVPKQQLREVMLNVM